MPTIFRARQILLWASIFALVALFLTSCANRSQASKESLYGELQLSEGKCIEVAVLEYIGTQTLYNNCYSQLKPAGHGEHVSEKLFTQCEDEIQMYVYAALTKVQDRQNNQTYYLPVTLYSYGIIENSDYPKVDVNGEPLAQCVAEARVSISQWQSYNGPGNYILVNLPVDQTSPSVGANTP
jgi:hypothetical protein